MSNEKATASDSKAALAAILMDDNAKKLLEGYPEIFGMVFSDEVFMSGAVSSDPNSATRRIKETKSVKKIIATIGIENEYVTTEELIGKLIEFTERLYNEPRDMTYAHPHEWAIVACMAVLSDFPCDMNVKEFLLKMSTRGGTAFSCDLYHANMHKCANNYLKESWRLRKSDRIKEKAYMLWQQSGCVHGKDKEHWVEAEKLVMQESLSGQSSCLSKKVE